MTRKPTIISFFVFILERKSALACEFETATLSCLPDEKIIVVYVVFGRIDRKTCWDIYAASITCRAGPAATTYVEEECNGRSWCTVEANTEYLGGDPCYLISKYLYVDYDCTVQ